MKKLLLTLLGAAALCGLSPHPASAQTDHSAKTFTITINSNAYTNGLILAGKRVKAALPDINNAENKTDLTIDETDPVILLPGVPETKASYGFGQIQFKQEGNDDILTLDFDFSKCPTDGTLPVAGTNRLSVYGSTACYLQLGPAGISEPSLGVRLSMGENKVIKKVVLTFCTNINVSTKIGNKEKFEDFLTTAQSFGSTERADGFTITNSPTSSSSSSMSLTSATYEASALYGSKEPLYLQMLKSTQTSIYISKIEVTYYDNTDNWIPKYETSLKFGKAYGDPIFYRTSEDNTTYTEWHHATGAQEIKLIDKYVQTKIGQAVTTFIRPSSSAFPATKPTVIIDPVKYLIGATTHSSGGVSFYTSADEDFSKNIDLKSLYSQEYYLNNYTGYAGARFLSAKYASDNITKPSQVTVSETSGNMISKLTHIEGLTAENAKYTVTANAQPLNIFVYNHTVDVTKQDVASFAMDEITLSFTSEELSDPQHPMAPVDIIPSTAIYSAKDGAYNIFGRIEVAAKINEKCIYPNAEIFYIKGDNELDNDSFEKNKATKLESGKIPVDEDCVISLRTYVTVDGIETASGVINRRFKKNNGAILTKASQLLDKSNEKKLVQLNFPLQTLASGYFSSDKKSLNILCRDTLGTAVRLITRLTEEIPTIRLDLEKRIIPGEAFKGTVAIKHDDMPFIPAGGVVGILEFDENDRPVVVLKDENNNIDNFEFCYSGAKKKYSDVKHDDNYHFIRNTFIGNRRDKISAEDYGKYVCIYAHFDQAAQTFTPIDGTEPLNLSGTSQFITSPVDNSYGNPALPSADGDYSVVGIVEYDAASQSYYIMPRAYTALITARPELSVENTKNGTQVVGEQIENDAKDGKTAVIKMLKDQFQISCKNAATAQMCYYEFFDGEQFKNGSISKASTKPALKIKSFDNEKKVVVTAYLQNCDNTQAPYVASESYVLTVKDVVSTAPVFQSIAEVKEELKDKTVADLTGKYYKVDANMVVLGFDETNKYMYLRDVDSDGFIVALSENVWTNYPFVLEIENTYTTIYQYHKPRIGDQITEITFTPVAINGVVVADLSGLEGNLATSGGPKSYQWGYIRGHAFSTSDWNNDPDHAKWGNLKFGEPMYTHHMDRLSAPMNKAVCYDASHPADAAKLTFDDANIADYVNVQNVKLTATEDADPVFSTDGLGTDLTIDWSMLPADISTAALADDPASDPEPALKDVKAEIIQAYNDAKTEGKDVYFNLSGYIFKTADAQGYELRIKDYSMTEAAPLPQVKVTVAGKDIEATPAEDDESKLTASFLKTASVSSPDAEAEDADYEILMSVNGGEFEAYDADKLAGLDAKTTVAFKCPVRPGYLAGERATTLTLDKESDNVSTLAEMAQGTNAKDLYHFRKHLKVIAADGEGTVMAADAAGRIALIAGAPAAIEAGKYVTRVFSLMFQKNVIQNT